VHTVRYTSQFKKDLKLAQRRGHSVEKLKEIIQILARGESLNARYRDHALLGQYTGTRECHVQPDWLLIYRIVDDDLILVRTGSHADLF
jgi:mRNA interferase YafQ